MGKTYTAKTLSNNFKVTNLENSLLSQQVVTSKGISVPYTNLQLNPYPNAQLDLFCSDNLSFQCTTPSTWLANCVDPSMPLNHQLEKDVGCKVIQFITRWRSRNSLVTKPYGVQTQQLLCYDICDLMLGHMWFDVRNIYVKLVLANPLTECTLLIIG